MTVLSASFAETASFALNASFAFGFTYGRPPDDRIRSMFIARGLRANILINIAILLSVGMLLTGFVMMMTLQKDVLRSEIARGNLFLSAVEPILTRPANPITLEPPDLMASERIDVLVRLSDVAAAAVFDRKGRAIYTADQGRHLSEPTALAADERHAW